MTLTEHNGDQALLPPSRIREPRTLSAASMAFPPRNQSLAVSIGMPAPGSFSSDLRTAVFRNDTTRPDLNSYSSSYVDEDARAMSEKRLADLRGEIEKETKIKTGSENMLEALNSKSAKGVKEQKRKVEDALNSANKKLLELRQGLEAEIQRSKETFAAADAGLPALLRNGLGRPSTRQGYPPDAVEFEIEDESPTYVLSEILEALEVDNMKPEYYVGNMNKLVELFKRYSTLKYDLVWSIFGLRMQTMLISDNRDVVAAGYRVLRYAITDRKALQTIRELHTDYLVILSLVKDSKASVEREQALKFVRAFLDVKDGVRELSRAIMRIVVAVAGHADDRLRNIAILTLAEVAIRDPPRLVDAGGMRVLTEALGHGNYRATQSLTGAFIYLLDTPARRKNLRSGRELEVPLSIFGSAPLTETQDDKAHEAQLRSSSKVILTFLRSWPGLITLSTNNFAAVRSLVASLYIPMVPVRTVLLELFNEVLRIKPPSWSSSFLAGRRLTTYARVTNLKSETTSPDEPESEEETNQRNLVDHFTAVVLGVFLHSGFLEALLHAEEDPLTLPLKRKTSLIIGEVLKMANELLPASWTSNLQVLPQLLNAGVQFDIDERFISVGTLYQVDSVNRTLYRSEPSLTHPNRANSVSAHTAARKTEQSKAQQNMQMDEAQFRTMMLDTGVLTTITYTKWRWEIIQNIIEGPLRNPKRLDEAIKSTKFLHRLLGFYRPFKWRFNEVKNTKPGQRYVRVGSLLMQTLMSNPEGVEYLKESKLIAQVSECLAHYDRQSGIQSDIPMFSEERLSNTITGGYLVLLGALSKVPNGFKVFTRRNLYNIFHHIIDLKDRDDLIKTILSGMDYSLDGHLRILLSKAMTSCSKAIRIFSTRLLRKYATQHITDANMNTVEWAIQLLITQLYDPEIEVCEVAIKILEEACKQKHALEFIVKCRPALDHLGEIGAPLLLRFLSTSVGYKYLDELDYITKEMDDWFLGRNDTYVAVIEGSLARALADIPEKSQQAQYNAYDDSAQPEIAEYGVVPPHFYRELTRTVEGCKLLAQKRHFDEFVGTIVDFGLEEDDAETILKVKGCLWAVGNVGSMELGAPFLEHTDVVRAIVRIAECSEVMTVRGTAFFALGLISRSLHGQEILTEFGWDGTVNMRGEALGFCLPLEFERLFKLKPWTAQPDDQFDIRRDASREVKNKDPNPETHRVLQHVAMMGNTVLSNRAAGDLNRYVSSHTIAYLSPCSILLTVVYSIKSRNPTMFQKPHLFHKVMGVLESHHFHHGQWQYAMNLFDRKLMRQIVLEEDNDDADDSEEGDDGDSMTESAENSTVGGYGSESVGDDDDYYEH
jgi:hypothetical protein